MTEIEEAFEYWREHSIFEIAANMADRRYEGIYGGKKYHAPDFDKCI